MENAKSVLIRQHALFFGYHRTGRVCIAAPMDIVNGLVLCELEGERTWEIALFLSDCHFIERRFKLCPALYDNGWYRYIV
tara:strand:- start:248 stop:487 length:240 start_codon:yes stop_codon:yes gene_type:complete